MALGFLTSSSLIATVKREAMIPTSQSTFTEADFLAIANQEIRIGMLPSIMQYHEEYLTRTGVPVAIQANQSAYAIPYRAVGGKFREVFYLDSSNQLRSMTRINPDNRPEFAQSVLENSFIYFFIEGNDVVLVPEVGANPSGSLVFTYYMRPNELVNESRVATIQSIATTNTSGTITNITAAASAVVTSTAHGLTTGNIIKITSSNSTPIIDGFYTVTTLSANTFSIPVTTTVAGTTGSWTFKTTTYTVDSIPQNVTPFLQGGSMVSSFSTSASLDVLQRNPGHKTIAFDISPLALDATNKTITFYTPDVMSYAISPGVGSAAVPGDYVAFSGECIIPQIPSDLHDVLSQRIVLRCLQALGDTQGYQVAAAKLAEMEKYMGSLIDNRSEGQAQKINNIRGVLRSSKLRNTRWFR